MLTLKIRKARKAHFHKLKGLLFGLFEKSASNQSKGTKATNKIGVNGKAGQAKRNNKPLKLAAKRYLCVDLIGLN